MLFMRAKGSHLQAYLNKGKLWFYKYILYIYINVQYILNQTNCASLRWDYLLDHERQGVETTIGASDLETT